MGPEYTEAEKALNRFVGRVCYWGALTVFALLILFFAYLGFKYMRDAKAQEAALLREWELSQPAPDAGAP